VFGIPVVFGPRYQKFREARDLVSAGGAFSIASLPELQRVVGTLYTDPKRCTQSGSICREYVQQHRGATDMILNSINL
jgi:3-deoxy-D-manno-octulosonic-acid transferase